MNINFKDLPGIRRRHKDKKIIFSSGTFDLTHAGHVLYFEDCKKLGDIFIVMVGNDLAVRKSKGKDRPVMNQYVRLKMVDSLKPVDYSFLDYPRDDDYYFGCLEEAFQKLRPDVYVINDDGRNLEKRKELTKKYDIKFVVLPRVAPKEFGRISTTTIIKKIEKEFRKKKRAPR